MKHKHSTNAQKRKTLYKQNKNNIAGKKNKRRIRTKILKPETNIHKFIYNISQISAELVLKKYRFS